MKKSFLALAALAATLGAQAMPANPTPAVTTQPDGSRVTLQLCGDEFYSFTTTTDGYTVVRGADGTWEYARLDGTHLAGTGVAAHDAGQRTPAELALLAATERRLTDRAAVAASHPARVSAQGPVGATSFDLDKFRGLIILVQPSDVTFTMGDQAQQFYNEVVNGKNFTRVSFGDYGTWTGSVRDYFYDNSGGKFDPQFDIVGPITVPYASTTFRNGYRTAFRDALDKALVNLRVDFSRYDGDGDGTVDNVCFVVAGTGANVQGNDENLLWPHESTSIGSGSYSGKRIDKYSCTTELGGSTSYPYVDGIGTFCHEFTHVLGLPDLYDTDYAENGQSHDPGNWDLMSAGGYLNNGRTPSGYGLWERAALGFATPTIITDPGRYTLDALGDSGQGYILPTPVAHENFYIENRQQSSKWDRYLPGHGMVVIRVDSTAAVNYLWRTNRVNYNPNHMAYELLRAGNTASGDLASDPFPGSGGVAVLDSYTTPSLRTWTGVVNERALHDISESGSQVSFLLLAESDVRTYLETFNRIPVTTTAITEAKGDIGQWRLGQCQAVTVSGSNRAVAMKNPSVAQLLEPLYCDTYMVSFEANNTSAESAKFTLQYSTDGGTKWSNAKSYSGSTTYTLPGTSQRTVCWNVDLGKSQGVTYRITMNGGSKTAPVQVDNFTVYYTGTPGSGGVRGDVDGSGVVDVDDMNILINVMLKKVSLSDYPAADIDGSGVVDVVDMNNLINIMLKKE